MIVELENILLQLPSSEGLRKKETRGWLEFPPGLDGGLLLDGLLLEEETDLSVTLLPIRGYRITNKWLADILQSVQDNWKSSK